jgi:hypothetical protein
MPYLEPLIGAAAAFCTTVDPHLVSKSVIRPVSGSRIMEAVDRRSSRQGAEGSDRAR